MNNISFTCSRYFVQILISFFFLSVFVVPLYAQFQFNPNCQQAYRDIISLKFTTASVILQEEKTNNPKNLIPLYLENFRDFLSIYISEEDSLYFELKKKEDERLFRLAAGNPDSPFYLFCQGQIAIQWAVLKFKFGDYTSGAMDMRKAYLLFSCNQERFPAFVPNNIGLGVIRVLAGIIPSKLQWIAGILGVEGSVEKGYTGIQNAAMYHGIDTISILYKPEAFFYLALISANLQKQKKNALLLVHDFYSSDVYSEEQDSPLLLFARVSILLKNGKNDEALTLLQHRKTIPGSFPFYYLDYQNGDALLHKLDLNAKIHFLTYTRHFNGVNYIKSAYQRLAWIGLLKGDTIEYNLMMQKVIQKGATQVDEDKQAIREAENGEIPSVMLLQARLLFDGGYYNKALHILLDNQVKDIVSSHKDLIEYTYRLGRIYHELGQIGKALTYYELTIRRGKNESYYYAANAALQMGLIYENSGQNDKATDAYRLCLSMNPEDYKNSLHQKAKTGLNRIKNIKTKT